ncbi:MAG TPA: CSLREA domain-containing protein, partial [Humisphaera sp.]|nr:CSLREA domain-containing protein [Humisphaera sp.]
MRNRTKGRTGPGISIARQNMQRAVRAAIEPLEVRRMLASITVTTTADDITPNDGTVSLREAITAINAGTELGDTNITAQNPGTFGTNDTINFNIPGTGVHTIMVGSDASATGLDLPAIIKPVLIDGTTQPGFDTTTHVPIIQLDGTDDVIAGIGIRLDTGSGGSVIRGLIISHFNAGGAGTGIFINFSNGNTIAGNYIGTDPLGTSAEGNTEGIEDLGVNNTIGGTSAGARNVISGNTIVGIASDGDIIQGNYIGTDASGTLGLGNGGTGVQANGADLIGGASPAARNVISGISLGIDVGGDNATVAGNYIGTDFTGMLPVGNTGNGVELFGNNDTVGGTLSSDGNIIAFNGGEGVVVFNSGTENVIRHNSIFSNKGLGIDLGHDLDGVNPNDPGDADTGANDLQNFPVLASAITLGGSTTITGEINTNANTALLVDVYANAAPDPSGFGQGQTFLGTIPVVTDSSGNATFTGTFPVTLTIGETVSATATTTASAPHGDTSAFSQDIDATTNADAPLTATGSAAIPASEGKPFTTTVAKFTDADTQQGIASDFTASIS